MPDYPVIIAKTERLTMRAMEVKDAPEVYRYRNQPDVMIFQGWTPQSADEVKAYAESMNERAIAAAGHWYQVVLDYQGIIVGDVAFCIETEHEQQAELGIAIDTQYQKLGFAQEATRGLVDYLFTTHNLHRIHVSIDPQNHASRKLIERCGFRFEGHLKKAVWFKGQWCDDLILAILREEWQQQK
ncbi:GNAT family N-acetyltransferase [Aliikangiella marina]|uniref:GNAT family N-acetyltransferase n=1 Tax=Aliikangiella marina TaxID=1712262 RepID=A0A545T8V5_9GAMM|nr:GNAT family protein [Aliikangiella marina]TQV73652.1 GNAT family N-acetyltransferase [Aliikangiella marina]